MSEATGPFLPIYLQMPRDPKVVAFAATLDVDRQRAVGMLIDLWVWAFGVAATDGTIRRCSAQQLAMVMEWPRTEAAYLEEALKDAEWASRVNGDIVLHEWELYGGKVKAMMQRERERKREYRKRFTGGGNLPSPTVRASLVPGAEPGTGEGMSGTASADGPRTGTRTATHSRRRRSSECSEVGEGGAASASQHAAPAPQSWLISFPCQGKQATWGVTAELLAELQGIYPSVDVRAELTKCAGKVRGGAITMKTARGMLKAVYSWLDNAVKWGSSPRHGGNGGADVPDSDVQTSEAAARQARNAAYAAEIERHAGDPLFAAYRGLVTAGKVPVGFERWKASREAT